MPRSSPDDLSLDEQLAEPFRIVPAWGTPVPGNRGAVRRDRKNGIRACRARGPDLCCAGAGGRSGDRSSGFDQAKVDEGFFAAVKSCFGCDPQFFPKGTLSRNLLATSGTANRVRRTRDSQAPPFNEACPIWRRGAKRSPLLLEGG